MTDGVGLADSWCVEDDPAAASARIDAIIAGVHAEGTCWLGGATWRGRRLIRISVSNYPTTAEDIDASVAAISQRLPSTDCESASTTGKGTNAG